jgi:hypothetical protein
MSSLVSSFFACYRLWHYGNQFVSLVDLIVLLIDILNFQVYFWDAFRAITLWVEVSTRNVMHPEV